MRVCADFDLRGQRLVVVLRALLLNDTGLFTVLVLVQNLVGTWHRHRWCRGWSRGSVKRIPSDWRFAGNLRLSAILLGFRLALPVALVALAIASIGQGVTMLLCGRWKLIP